MDINTGRRLLLKRPDTYFEEDFVPLDVEEADNAISAQMRVGEPSDEHNLHQVHTETIPPTLPLEWLDKDHPEIQEWLAPAVMAWGKVRAINAIIPEEIIPALVIRDLWFSFSIDVKEPVALRDVFLAAHYKKYPGFENARKIYLAAEALEYAIQKTRKQPPDMNLIWRCHKIIQYEETGTWKDAVADITPKVTVEKRPYPESEYMGPSVKGAVLCLDELDAYCKKSRKDLIVSSSLASLHFSLIHPFVDLDGVMSRLLGFLLFPWSAKNGDAHLPVFGLNEYLYKHSDEYSHRFDMVCDKDDYEGWVGFHLRCVSASVNSTIKMIRKIQKLQRETKEIIYSKKQQSLMLAKLADELFRTPVISAKNVAQRLGVSTVTAWSIMKTFKNMGILERVEGPGREQLFLFKPYLDILS